MVLAESPLVVEAADHDEGQVPALPLEAVAADPVSDEEPEPVLPLEVPVVRVLEPGPV